MAHIKIRPNKQIKSELCRCCKFLYKINCPKFKFSMSTICDESVLSDIEFIKIENEIDEIVVCCKKYKRDFFLSDVFGFLNFV